MNIFRLILFILPTPLMELQPSLFERRMELFNFVSTLGDLTKYLRKTSTLFLSFPICSLPQVRPVSIWP